MKPILEKAILIVMATVSILTFTPFDKDLSIDSTSSLITHIKTQKEKNHLRAFTFVQETIHYNDQGEPKDTTTWYEAIRYPKDFRIDFGDPEKGNANVNRNDSIYVFRGNKLVHKGPEIQEFLILEGGLHYYSAEETIYRLQKLGIDTETFTKSTYQGKPVFIIGAKEGEHSKPQIWLDAKELHAIRRFNMGKKGELYEVRYDNYQDFDGHRIETWIEFWLDGKLIQTERYNQIDIAPNLSDADFDPSKFGSIYWFKK